MKKTSTFNLLNEPKKTQLLGPSTFIRKDAIKTFFLNDFNEYISFLNDILINTTKKYPTIRDIEIKTEDLYNFGAQ